MIDFLKQLPHLEAYGNPFYFIYLGLALLPIFVGLFFKKRFAIYECLVSLAFIVLALTGTHASQLLALLFYIVWQIIWVSSDFERFLRLFCFHAVLLSYRSFISQISRLLLSFYLFGSGFCKCV